MSSVVTFAIAVAVLATSGGMIAYEYMRGKTDRPLKNNEAFPF